MLHLHFANHHETLVELLLERLGGERADVFAADPLIVPNAALRRALTLAIADREGICAQVRFEFLAQWLWRQVGALVPGVAAVSPFSPPLLSWRVHAALCDEVFVAAHPRLAGYLHAADALMRFELAGRVAALLDEMLTYRPDWAEAWAQGRLVLDADATARNDERWQAALWQRLVVEVGSDPLQPLKSCVAALESAAPGSLAALPAAAHVFALPTMPPLHIQLLVKLGRHVDLHLYVRNPCREYWFELVDRRRLSHLALQGRDERHEEGHRLLAGWGRQTQSHVDALIEIAGDAIDDEGRYTANPAGHLLARLQNSILDLEPLAPGSLALADDDRSIELHVCHSLTRELEVLHDRLLSLFAADPTLRAADILVVTPDLESAAPLIDAVFGTLPDARRLPYTVSGRGRSQASAPARALLALLALAASRHSASAVFALLQQAIVARRFGLDDAALQTLHEALRASGLHWALDAAHRERFGMPADAHHTLADALERLFLGHALPAHIGEPFDGLLPAGDLGGSEGLLLGAFWRFADTLRRFSEAVAQPHRPAAWRELLLEACADFLLAEGDEQDDLRELQTLIGTLAAQMRHGGDAAPLPLAVLRSALEQLLDDPARGGVPTGGITFSSMSSLRGLPYAVVCVVGLDDGIFPSTQRPPEFDLLALAPRRGDRQRRDDERNLFLDLLLAARCNLVLSHTGRSVRDNAPLPPSVLVSELLDLLLPAITDDPSSADALARARARLVVEHPLQAFSTAAFEVAGDRRLRSYNVELGEALRRSLQARPAPAAGLAVSDGDDDSDEDDAFSEAQAPFFTAPLAPPDTAVRRITLAQLQAFFANPCRFLLLNRLGIALRRPEDELQDDEPFLPDWPERQALAGQLLPPLLAGASSEQLLQLAHAGTAWPLGTLGKRALEVELGTLSRFAARLQSVIAAACLPPHSFHIEIDLDGEAWTLSGGFADLRPEGRLGWRCDEARAREHIEAWLQHLVLCADPPPGVALTTRWLSRRGGFAFGPVAQPQELLRDWLAAYRRGMSEPLHFFPKSAWALVESGGSIAKARATWRVSKDQPHREGADPAYRLALRGQPDALDDAFTRTAQALLGPLLDHLETEV